MHGSSHADFLKYRAVYIVSSAVRNGGCCYRLPRTSADLLFLSLSLCSLLAPGRHDLPRLPRCKQQRRAQLPQGTWHAEASFPTFLAEPPARLTDYLLCGCRCFLIHMMLRIHSLTSSQSISFFNPLNVATGARTQPRRFPRWLLVQQHHRPLRGCRQGARDCRCRQDLII